MKKIFLYLYPIQEYNRSFEFSEEYLYEIGRDNPYKVLNECIQKRYREKEYEIVYAIYPGKKIYGVKTLTTDKIIYTDVTFEQASGYNHDGSEKQDRNIKYPSEKYLIEQLGNFDEIVIGGFHFGDCVKRVAEYCYQSGFPTLIDLDLTDLFFSLYYKKDYFKIDEYSPKNYKNYILSNSRFSNMEIAESLFERNYNSPVYGFENDEKKKIKKFN